MGIIWGLHRGCIGIMFPYSGLGVLLGSGVVCRALASAGMAALEA